MKREYKQSMALPGGAQSVYKVDRPAWYLQGDSFNFIVGLTAFVSFIVVWRSRLSIEVLRIVASTH